MIFEGRSLQDISLDDIRALVESHVPEGPCLEYKQTAYDRSPRSRHEMLCDIAALANADGGYLILGIRDDGVNRAAEITPFDNPCDIAKSIRDTCMDCIRERIDGLEVRAYETGFNQGIVVVHVPTTESRPHMVIRERHTDFFRRYGTDKREMTIGEIRDLILTSPRFRRLVGLELEARGPLPGSERSAESAVPPYLQLIMERPVEAFVYRYLVGGISAQTMLIVSPFISDLAGTAFELGAITKKAESDGTRLYVITRPPQEEYHRAGVSVLEQCPVAEIRYNPDVHAKLYLVWSRDEGESYALFGSGNLAESGLKHNIELGMMIYARGHGRAILRELYQWGGYTLRSMSQRIKAIGAHSQG